MSCVDQRGRFWWRGTSDVRLTALFGVWVVLWAALSAAQAAPTFVNDPSCDDLPVAVICGTVDVPENQLTDSGTTITLDVYVLKALGDEKVPDPIVFLDGGPGGRATSNFSSLSEMKKLRETRDIVIVNQRGTSTADWLCPTFELDEAFIIGADIDFDEANRRTAGAIKDCFAKRREIGQEPSNYTNHANAQDFKDVRQALGVQQWNLWGTSYGTALAQEIIKVDPDGVRSAVMDSVVPLDTGWARGGDDHHRDAFEALNADCQADRRCAVRFGDLHELRKRALATLKEEPLFFDEGIGKFSFQDEKLYETHVVGDDRDLFINDHDFSSFVFTLLYTEYYYPIIPLLMDRVAARDQRFMDLVIDNLVGGKTDTDYGVYFAISCRFPMPTEAEMQEEFARNKEWLGGISEVRYLPDICAELDLPPVDAKDWDLPQSDVPVLIISGQRDPITPAWFGDHVAKSLPNSQVSVFTHQSHGPAYSNCGVTLLTDFFNRPFKTKVRNCDQTENDFVFLTDIVGTAESIGFAETPQQGFWEFAKLYTSLILAGTIACMGILLFAGSLVRGGVAAAYTKGVLLSRLSLIAASAIAVTATIWFCVSAIRSLEDYQLAEGFGIGIIPIFGPWVVWSVPVILAALLVSFAETIRVARAGSLSAGDVGFQLSLILSTGWLGAFLIYFGIHPDWGWDWYRWVVATLNLKFFFY